MSFSEKFHDIDNHYNNDKCNIARDLIVPVLKEAKAYDRAVGFFCSTSLIETSVGISEIVKKGGHIRYIMSPRLSLEDIETIKKGYDNKKDRDFSSEIDKILLESISEPLNEYEKDHLNYLANLISLGFLEIKIAMLKKEYWGKNTNPEKIMFHSKIGIMYDENGDCIGFEGSANDSDNGYVNNFESITMTSSMNNKKIVESLKEDFESGWSDEKSRYEFRTFPQALRDKIMKYRTRELDLNIDERVYEVPEDYYMDKEEKKFIMPEKIVPHIPKNENGEDILYPYQREAITKWLSKENKAVGIYNMATGAGKTFTAYGSMVKLYERRKRLPIVIVCPQKHLVDQWVDDIMLFGFENYVLGYSGKEYKSKLKNFITAYNMRDIDYFVFVVCLGSFRSKEIQDILNTINDDILLVADEAHNMGAKNIRDILDQKYKFRLALSATIDRHNDEEGTNFLHSYFGKECITFSLRDAINAGKLCSYYYYPICNYMDDEERQKYLDLSRSIAQASAKSKGDKMSEKMKNLLIERARLVAGVKSKIDSLERELSNRRNDYYMLIYCGTSTYADDDKEVRQIKKVCDYLGNQLNIKIQKYTSDESPEERKVIKSRFESGDDLQALVAIKCLDEGVNIPRSKIAYLLASCTNPREYIQRRGRVLRIPKDDREKIAFIYDFITLPCHPTELCDYGEDDIRYFASLVKKEIVRMEDFADCCLEKSLTNNLIKDLTEEYNLDDFDIVDIDNFDIDWRDEDAK